MSDLGLDAETVAAQSDAVRYVPSDPWLRRRALRMGASDVPALLLAYDLRPEERDSARQYHRDAAAITQTRRGPMPMVIARKAGLRRPERTSETMRRGTAREPALLRAWARSCEDVTGLRLASELPPWARHAVDHECSALAATLDAAAVDTLTAAWLVLEAKCPREYVAALPWYWRAQIQAQLAVTDLALGWVVVGPGWGASDEGGGEPYAWPVARDNDEIARIRRVCTMAAAALAVAMEER